MSAGKYDHISDAELLDLYRQDNDQEWIGLLLSRYTLLLLGVCMKYLKDEQEARDGVQQIFLKVLSDIGKYEISFFKSWLYMVAKNYCLQKLRDKKSKKSIPVTDKIEETLTYNADLPIKEEKTYELLEESLTELNSEQQKCVILFYLKKKSYNEISEETGYTILQVKSYIQNGKRNLKNLLEKKLQQNNETRS